MFELELKAGLAGGVRQTVLSADDLRVAERWGYQIDGVGDWSIDGGGVFVMFVRATMTAGREAGLAACGLVERFGTGVHQIQIGMNADPFMRDQVALLVQSRCALEVIDWLSERSTRSLVFARVMRMRAKIFAETDEAQQSSLPTKQEVRAQVERRDRNQRRFPRKTSSRVTVEAGR